MTEPSLSGRNCLITGATGGLGRALAQAFWSAGASLAVTGRDERQLDKLARQLGPGRSDQKLVAIASDLCQTEAETAEQRKNANGVVGAPSVLARAHDALGVLTVLVNNAGMQGSIGPLWENNPAVWERTLRLNLLVPFELCRLVLPRMLGKGYGKIINVSGGGATSSRPNFSAYAASKTGLVRLTEVLADETRGKGIDVNAIAPGAMNTRMLDEVVSAGPAKAGHAEFQRASKQADGGGVSPDQAARLAVFLASADSDGITGKLISAVWDPWERLPERLEELRTSDIYTLRRIVPSDRGKDWGNK